MYTITKSDDNNKALSSLAIHLRYIWAKTENPLLQGVTKLISMLFFGDINWAKLSVLLK